MASQEFEDALLAGNPKRARSIPNVNLSLEYPRIIALGSVAIRTFIQAFPEDYYLTKIARLLVQNYRPEYLPLIQELWNQNTPGVTRVISEAFPNQFPPGSGHHRFSLPKDKSRELADQIQAGDLNEVMNALSYIRQEALRYVRNYPLEIQRQFLSMLRQMEGNNPQIGNTVRQALPELVNMIIQNYSSKDNEFLAALLDMWKELGIPVPDDLPSKMAVRGVPASIISRLRTSGNIETAPPQVLLDDLVYAIDAQDKNLLNELSRRGVFQLPESKSILSQAFLRKIQLGPETNSQILNDRAEWIRWLLQSGA